ncbi:para-aminobenzoate synthase component 1 [Candidatus Blochmanniella vafra str. BVAF]|uniref:aminodeoxychorismate synthase n=1 Tax=Blochmanniella vafra (strain BVAF) TaxID=859654 RepID=E8Q709_BLOVB|nr:aminodeoxychorismate synthase component I [Candidatus Blochmannia vafer]ADV33833.1 para-aminobenzoate synthase component 1 [Candidatus Blochmannia vafer str. BVAF]
MTINLIELPYHPNATLNLFESLSNTPWSMLLYSGYENKHSEGRYDILVTNPVLTLLTYNDITTISSKKFHKISKEDPFLLLKKYIQTYQLQSDNNYPIPFQGGFLGTFGYDLARRIEQLPNLSKKDIYLPDMALGLYRWAIISDHKLFKNYLVTHDHPDMTLSWIKKQHIYHNCSHYTGSFKLLNPWKSNIDYSEYLKKIQIIKKNLISGNCYQICLAQRFLAPYIGNEWAIFRYLLNYNQVPFSAFIRLPNNSSILSFSPERFIQLKKSKIKTQPIKGTLCKLNNKKSDKKQKLKLFQSVKNQSENLMIVDLLRNDLGKVSIPGSIYVTKLFDIQSFSKIHHMVSTIIGILDTDNFSACDLLKACFPGGSITGAPKIQAMKLIEELEPHRRSVWSGSIGYLSCCGNMDSNIIIRTLLSEKKYLFCFVGNGIIFDSNQELEYQEMQDKMLTLLIPILKQN